KSRLGIHPERTPRRHAPPKTPVYPWSAMKISDPEPSPKRLRSTLHEHRRRPGRLFPFSPTLPVQCNHLKFVSTHRENPPYACRHHVAEYCWCSKKRSPGMSHSTASRLRRQHRHALLKNNRWSRADVSC